MVTEWSHCPQYWVLQKGYGSALEELIDDQERKKIFGWFIYLEDLKHKMEMSGLYELHSSKWFNTHSSCNNCTRIIGEV